MLKATCCHIYQDPNYDLKVRRTTGIPKSFLRLADKPTQKGALLIPDTGQYAVPIVDQYVLHEYNFYVQETLFIHTSVTCVVETQCVYDVFPLYGSMKLDCFMYCVRIVLPLYCCPNEVE